VIGRISIRVRVAAAFALAMAIVLTGMSWLVYDHLGAELGRSIDNHLHLRALDLAADVETSSSLFAADIATDFGEPGERYAQLIDPNSGRVVRNTPLVGTRPLLGPAELRRARANAFFGTRERVPGLDEPSRFLADGVDRGTTAYVLVVGATLGDRQEALESLRRQLLIVVPAALLLATLAGYLLAGYALRPVESMRSRAASISAETAGERLPVPRTRDEIERLGHTLNAMLARLETALQRERDFVADAGHELRTPLALLRTELELALRHAGSPDELREAIRLSSTEVDRLAQLAEHLLLIARSDAGKLALRREPIEIADLMASVESRFEWRAQAAARPLLVDAPRGLVVSGDRIRLEQALGNIVDNALRHGEGAVRLSATVVDGRVEFHVTDDGPGFPSDVAGHAFDRFARADSSRSRGGAGLGLSIVQTIAVAHGGTAHLANTSAAGADVWISLPILGGNVPLASGSGH
jgi:signal transduction histidine kinase